MTTIRRLSLCLLLGCPAVATAQQLEAVPVASGLDRPVKFVQHPTLPHVQLVVEQGGRIRVLDHGALAGDYADLTGSVNSTGERGLLGLAFAPDFAVSRRVFLNFTNPAGHTVIARFRQPTDTVVALDASSRFDLLWPGADRFILQPFANHNGGDLAFGPDGFLYIPLGDGGDADDPLHNAQTPGTLLGKMLRIDVGVPDTDVEGYDVPADNPFVGQIGVLPEIWAFGLRNPWRFSFDDPARGGTGALVLGDVGQVRFEEVDYEPAGRGGRNYGWRNREGAHDHIASPPPAYVPLTDPLWEYPRLTGQSITGGYVYRGTALGSQYVGRYFFGDFAASRVWSLALSVDPATGEATAFAPREHTASLGAAAVNPSSFGVDADGELYVTSYAGSVYRIVVGDLIDNGTFDGALQPNGVPVEWGTWAQPALTDIVFTTEGGRMNFLRPPGSTQAVVLQNTGVPVPALGPIDARFDVGNSDGVRKRISALIHDEDFSEVTVCTFWLDPFTAPRTYRMRTHATEPWTGATISFYAATASGGGFYQLDDVSMRLEPAQSASRTICDDPQAPAGGGSEGGELLANGGFDAGLVGWGLYGEIVAQVVSGVAEFFRPPGTPAGTLLQPTGTPIAQDQRLLASFRQGNSSGVRQRITVLIHDRDFSDLHACTFYLPAGQALSAFSMLTYATASWTDATVSFYPATAGASPSHEWLRLDDVSLTRVTTTTAGTECVEPG
jgi:glucose/arabinose dehydrogenase